MKRLFLFFFLCTPLMAFDVTLRVVDPVSGRALPDVRIIIRELPELRNLVTDATGSVKLTGVKVGYLTVRAIIPGVGIVQPRLEVRSAGQVLTIFSREKPPEEAAEKAQIASGQRGIVVRGVREKTRVSRFQVRLDEIKRLPGQFGEALRGIETLPGVNAPAFGNGAVNIRGADDRANAYYIDDLPIGYAFHFFPVNSTIHNDMVKSIDLYTGAYPAIYGNVTGGIIAIETIDEVDKFGGNASFAVWAANVLIKGPLEAGKGYYIVAGRHSYMHITLQQFIPPGIQAPIYWDTQAKFRYHLSETQKLTLYSFAARDWFAAKIDPLPSWDPTTEPDPVLVGGRVDLNRSYHTEAIRHTWQPGSRLQNDLTFYITDNTFYVDGKIGAIEAEIQNRNGWVALKDRFSYELHPEHAYLNLGFETWRIRAKSEGRTVRQIDPSDPDPDPYDEVNPDFETVPVRDEIWTTYQAAYAELRLAGYGFDVRPGARYEYLRLTEQWVLDPRFTVTYSAPTNTVLTAAAGLHHRLPSPFQLSPTSGNPDLKMERAEHYVAGVEQEIGNWLLKLETYRTFFRDTVVNDPYITTPARINSSQRLDDRIKEPVIYNDRMVYSNDGDGRSYGYEIYIKKNKPPEAHDWFGWISYTYSRTYRNDHQHIPTTAERSTVKSADESRIINQYDNSRETYADFDRRHILNIVLGWKWNREYQIGGRWKYATSTPYTPIIGDDGGRQRNNDRVIFDPVFSQYVNSARFAPYHRLDLRIDRFLHYEWGFGSVFLEALNVYLRQNPTGESFSHARPFSGTNPSPQYDFGLLEYQIDSKRKLRFPLINFGVEVQF